MALLDILTGRQGSSGGRVPPLAMALEGLLALQQGEEARANRQHVDHVG
jgi:hypothetical protein